MFMSYGGLKMDWQKEKDKLSVQQVREYTIQKNLLFQKTNDTLFSICEAIRRAKKI